MILIMVQAQNLKIYYLLEKKCQLGFSSKIEVLQLGSARNSHSSARAGKIQLGLITTVFIGDSLIIS